MISRDFTELTDRTTIRLSGPDARPLLQKLLTVDLDDVGPEQARYGALLSPQGKILFDFFIAQKAEGYLLDCAVIQKSDLMQRLSFYRLRANMTIEDMSSEYTILANFRCNGLNLDLVAGDVDQDGANLIFCDPRTSNMGLRAFARSGGMISGNSRSEDEYHSHRISVGAADTVRDLGSNILFPHEANFDHFRGVDFTKGCYIGQEVVSRMEHRSTGGRKRIVRISVGSGSLLSGSAVTADQKVIGKILSTSVMQGLALVRLDHVAGALARRIPLTAAGAEVEVHLPAWADHYLKMIEQDDLD